jgi:CheY-like chemotaxis protein
VPLSVVVIDDDDDLRESLEMLLARRGYPIVVFSRADVALEKLRDGLSADVVLLDLMLPGMSGWAFRAALRDDPALRRIRVIIVSARHDLNAPGQPALTDVALLRKPFTPDALFAMIEKVCAEPSAT